MVWFWVLLAVAIVAVFVAVSTRRKSEGKAEAAPPSASAPSRVRPEVTEFHVRSGVAEVSFAVPVSDPVDEVLAELLVREAVEVLREKRSHGLPLDGLTSIKAFGKGPTGPVEVGSTELETPGELPPEQAYPDLVPHLSSAGFDPLAHLGEDDASTKVETAAPSRPDTIGPIGEEIRLTARLDAGLRAQGIDTTSMGAGEMVRGLLSLSGYSVGSGPKPGTYMASRAGQRTFIQEVDHAAGDYPELDESLVNSFILGFQSSGANQGLLVTDKFAPYVIYDKEKREPRIRFLSRERLQRFVDGMAVS